MPAHPSQVEPLKRLSKIVNSFLSRPDIGPFREPVDWRGLGLDDYPEVVKKMMDLGTVKRKLDRKQYYTAADCATDIRLIWSNCMLYNADGSDFWLLAKSFARRFEDRYRKIRQEFDVGADLKSGDDMDVEEEVDDTNNNDGDANDNGEEDDSEQPSSSNLSGNKRSATPTPSSNASGPPAAAVYPVDKRARFGANLFLLSGVELAHVIMKLEYDCPNVLEHISEETQVEGDEDTPNNGQTAEVAKLEINVDAIPTSLFDELAAYVLEKVGTKGHSDIKVDDVTHSRPHKKKQRKN